MADVLSSLLYYYYPHSVKAEVMSRYSRVAPALGIKRTIVRVNFGLVLFFSLVLSTTLSLFSSFLLDLQSGWPVEAGHLSPI